MKAAGRVLACVLALLPMAAAALPLCDSTENRVAFYRAMDPWRRALEAKRFADVDRHFNALIEETRTGKLTDQELHRWFELFRQPTVAREPLHEDWIRAFPNSAAAHLAAAYYYEGRGFNARGSEYADRTSSAQFQTMGLELRKAFDELGKVEALMARPTVAAAMRMWMHGLAGDPNGARIRDIYQSALKSFPESLQIRVTWTTLSHPKWYGSVDQLNAIMDDARTLSKDDQRYIRYLVAQELGSAYQQMERFDRAAEQYKVAIPLCPGLDRALTRAMQMYQDRKDFDALIPASTLYIERYPRNGWGYAMRGWAHTERKEWAQAARDYEKGAAFGSSYAQEGLAWLVEWGRGVKQDYARAIDLYETAAANGSRTAAAKAEKIRQGTGIAIK